MDREGGNKEEMRKYREWICLNFLILSPFPLHSLILFPFPHSLSISSSFSHSLSIFLHPRCKNAASCAALVVFSIRHKSQTRRRLLEIAKHVFDQSNKHKGSWQNWLSSWWLKKSSSTTHTGSFITEGLFGFQKLIFFSTNNGNFSNNHVSTSTSFILFFFDSLIQQKCSGYISTSTRSITNGLPLLLSSQCTPTLVKLRNKKKIYHF